MIKRILLILLLSPVFLVGQTTYGNDWIDFGQNYFKIPVYKDGVYRISYNKLLSSGVDLTQIDPRNIQIFAKGQEQYIYIEGEADGKFDAFDYIEFYGEQNDGWIDTALFRNGSDAGNPYYSMFNDTIYYFLTWNNSLTNKRMKVETDVTFSGGDNLSYFFDEVQQIDNSIYSSGKLTTFGWPVPEYSPGEGWMSSEIKKDKSKTVTLNTPDLFAAGPPARLTTSIVGRSVTQHDVKIVMGGSTDILDTFFYAYSKVDLFERQVSNTLLGATTSLEVKNVLNTASGNNSISIGYVSLKYPRQFTLSNATSKILYIPDDNTVKDLVEIDGFDDASSTSRFYDLTNHKRIDVQPVNGKFRVVIPHGSGAERKCLITSDNVILGNIVDKLIPVGGSGSFTNFKSQSVAAGNADYIIVHAQELLTGATSYRDYRTSTGYKPLLADVEELYDQYAYGIRKHPLAIRNFVKDMVFNWDSLPDYLFLLGKSVRSMDSRKTASSFQTNLVPTFGNLGSDVSFSNDFEPTAYLAPLMATGRLAATSNDDINNYLDKVKAYESAPAAEWMKNVLHFGGGKNSNEQTQFKTYLEEFEKIVEDTSFGGKVHTFLKNTSDPLAINLSDSVTNLINSGVSIMTFFGHAYGNNFDQSIDEPENYENTGRYPFILANSCLIGNIHLPTTSSGSERFVMAKDKGTIGFLASSSLGVATRLYNYSKNLLIGTSQSNYGASIGKQMQFAIQKMQKIPFESNGDLDRDVMLYMTLHCDPAIVINSQKNPDYTIYGQAGNTQPTVYFTPGEVTTAVDSFDVNIVVTNIGKAQNDTFEISLTREFPGEGASDTVYIQTVTNLYFKDTITFTLPVDFINGVGLNRLTVNVDHLDFVTELSETNNNAVIDLLIKSSEIIPIYPSEYAIVPDKYPVLKVSTGDPYSGLENYIFQIDINEDFSNPTTYNLTSKGGVLEWDPNVDANLKTVFDTKYSGTATLANPYVYFWRVSLDDGSGTYKWKRSSFQYVDGKSGWGQAHYDQFDDNSFLFIDTSNVTKDYTFEEQKKKILVRCLPSNLTFSPLFKRDEIRYEIDGTTMAHNSNQNSHMLMVAVIDKLSLEPWDAKEHGDFGHPNYTNKYSPDWNANLFYMKMDNTTGVTNLLNLLNAVPDSNYVIMYNFREHKLKTWFTGATSEGAQLKAKMKSLGADVDSLSNYNNSWPYAVFMQIGDSTKTIESFSSDASGWLSLSANMFNNWFNGRITSKTIGPSTKWGTLHWEIENGDSNDDSSSVYVYGIDNSGAKTLVYADSNLTKDVLDLENHVDAATYPYIQLEVFHSDDTLTTPSTIKRWQVTYDEVPEAALNPLKLTSTEFKDTVQQGETFQFVTAIENITNIDMDSLQIAYWIIDNNLVHHPTSYKVLAPLKANSVITDTITISTETMVAGNSLFYEVNPFTGGPKQWQLEQLHFNNLNLTSFHVTKDNINPLLDVTFDGIHILNGDIVSPKPYIVITLDDENQYLALNDSSLIELYLKTPSTNPDSVPLIDPTTYTFTPGVFPENKCKIEFLGDFPEDGKYELRVRATDRTKNVSGAGDGIYDYKINFEVVNASTITQVINWPNPFSTSTQFVFTLTGNEVPDEFMIQIMTITGKVVKEITKEEFGPINIGRNISNYKWNGTDQFGDRLANGVYLYRVVAKINGQNIDDRKTTISTAEGTDSLKDKYFKKGWGKMYILR